MNSYSDEIYVSIFPGNIRSNFKNLMFKTHKIMDSWSWAFVYLKKDLKKKGIDINTCDIPTKKTPVKYVYFDLPYPLPSYFPIWKLIFLNTKKNILVCHENPTINPFNYMKIFHNLFTKVYTWNDDLIDNKKYFKMRLPQHTFKFNTAPVNFEKKKFLILINTNKLSFFPFEIMSTFGRQLYSERIKAIEFFEKNIPNKFFLYGRGWNKPKKYNLIEMLIGYKKYSTYKGEVKDKLKLLSNFKYCICFENFIAPGYITEKIFDCFKTKCVPIYLGASNIEKYIPKNCFIDFRDFLNYEKLLNFLYKIDENQYNRYIENIEKLLANKKFVDLWFEKGFAKFFLKKILEIKDDQ